MPHSLRLTDRRRARGVVDGPLVLVGDGEERVARRSLSASLGSLGRAPSRAEGARRIHGSKSIRVSHRRKRQARRQRHLPIRPRSVLRLRAGFQQNPKQREGDAAAREEWEDEQRRDSAATPPPLGWPEEVLLLPDRKHTLSASECLRSRFVCRDL